MADDYFDFQRRQRATSVDGFINGAGQQPRRPGLRAANPQLRTPTQPVNTAPQKQTTDMFVPRQVATPTPQPIANRPPVSSYEQPTPSHTTSDTTDTTPASMPSAVPVGKPPKQKKTRKKKSWPRRIFKLLGILLLLAVLAFGARFVMDIAKLTGNSNPFALLGAFQRAPLKNENGRVNVLVAGNSADDAGHNGATLTDSIMVLSLDTKKNTAMMLSIPRDLWVEVPGYGHSKINAAAANGGMDKLSEVVETNLDMPIHYTALVNYGAFKDMVDAVGGITITIKSDNPKGIYDSSLDWTSRTCCALAKYPNGPVNLNGQQALNLARARGEGVGSYGFNADFTRTEHQRLMLLGIREKAMSSSTLSNPLKISNLVSAIGANVKTDLQLKEIQTLYSYAKEVDVNKIDSYNINTLKGEDETMLQNYTSPDGQSALIPAAGIDDFSEISAQIKRLFTASPVAKEAASVVVLNATETVGLARTQSAILAEKGMSIAFQGNATVQPTTTLVDVSGDKPNTLASLKTIYSATVITDATLKANYPNADIIVLLGTSAVPKSTSTTNQ